jgi:hypothetical protein
MDDDSLNEPHEAEYGNEDVNQRGQGLDVRSPEIGIQRLRKEKRSEAVGDDEPDLTLKSAHSGILSWSGLAGSFHPTSLRDTA